MRQYIAPAVNVKQPFTTFTETVDTFSIFDVIGKREFSYFSYLGSLTTPSEYYLLFPFWQSYNFHIFQLATKSSLGL